jgi:hypothetical protein
LFLYFPESLAEGAVLSRADWLILSTASLQVHLATEMVGRFDGEAENSPQTSKEKRRSTSNSWLVVESKTAPQLVTSL